MSERESFLRAICDSPDDDTPRLVFADWLEEHGEPERAEFIRLQCALAADPYRPQRTQLTRREGELFKKFGKRWLGAEGLARWIDATYLDAYHWTALYRRGFIEVARFIAPSAFLKAADDLFRLTPLRGLGLHMPYTFTAEQELRATNTYFRLVGLPGHADADPELPEPEEFRRLVASPAFARLSGFEMSSIYTDRRLLEILLGSPAAGGLRELDLSGNPLLQGEALAPLADAPALAGLESLTLNDSWMGPDGLRAVVDSPHRTNLRRLSLGACGNRRFGEEAFRAVTASTSLPRLMDLSLRGQGGGAAGLAALAAWPGLKRLTRLDVGYNFTEYDEPGPYAAALDRLLHSPHWGELRELSVAGDTIPDLGALEVLVNAPNVRTLRVLNLESDYRWGEDGPSPNEAVPLLAGAPHFADGLELRISRKNLPRGGARRLRERFGDGLVLSER